MTGIVIASASALSVAANAESTNQVANTYDYIGAGALICFAKASATGLQMSAFVNANLVARNIAIPFTGTAGTLDTSANMIWSANTLGGRVELYYRNTTGGALTVDFLLTYKGIPLGRGISRLLGR